MEKQIHKTLHMLCNNIGSRAPGSDNERKAARYVEGQFREMGYDPAIEEFRSPGHVAGDALLTLPEIDESLPAYPTLFSPTGKASGILSFLGSIDRPICDHSGLEGKIGLLIPSGGSSVSGHGGKKECLVHLERAGLAGLIVVSPHLDTANTKIVRYPEVRTMPVVVVSMRTAAMLRRHEGGGVTIDVEKRDESRSVSQNVVVTVPGKSDCGHWMVLSAHYDCTCNSAGTKDNASGTAVLLEVARKLAGKSFPATLCMAVTGCEEYGEHPGGGGAHDFFERRTDKLRGCIGHVAIDTVGGLVGIPDVIMKGNKPFRDMVLGALGEESCWFHGDEEAAGDDVASDVRGIPHVWFNDFRMGIPAMAFHTPEDTTDFVDPKMMVQYVDPVCRTVEAMASAEPFYRYVEENDLLIRPARCTDIKRILEITRIAFEPVSTDRIREQFFEESLGGRPWHEYKNKPFSERLHGDISKAIVTEADGEVVGYATFEFDAVREIAEITNNAVHPDWQGRGIGKAMQREVMRRMKEEGYTRFQVSTLQRDIAAQKVYEKLGFKECWKSITYLMKDG